MSDKSRGQVAFEAYSESMSGKTFDGRPIPKWDELGVPIQEGWESAAQAAILAELQEMDDLR